MLTPYYDSPEGQIYHGHVLQVLKAMPAESVQMCVTSPPYWGLRDYGNEPQIWDSEPPEICEGGRDHVWNNAGFDRPCRENTDDFCQLCNAWRGSLGLEPTPELFIKHMVQIFAEVKRVLRDDGTLWLNIGDSYAGSMSGSWKDPELSKINKNMHYNNGRTAAKRADPAYTKIKMDIPGLKPKDLVGIPWMLAFALRADGWYLRSDIIWAKNNPMPESCKDRPTKAHEYLFLLTKSPKYFYDCEAIRENHLPESIKRMEGLWDGERQRGYPGNPQTKNIKQACHPSGRNKRTVWTIPTQPMPDAHFATFPEKLIEPCILAGCPKDGTTLDPFIGSGTVAIVSHKHGRHFIGIELSQTYLDEIAIPRIKKETKQLKLFA